MRSITFISLIVTVYLLPPSLLLLLLLLLRLSRVFARAAGNYLTDCRFEVNFAVTFPRDTSLIPLPPARVTRSLIPRVAAERKEFMGTVSSISLPPPLSLSLSLPRSIELTGEEVTSLLLGETFNCKVEVRPLSLSLTEASRSPSLL